jgi:hypothetical protein
MKIISFNDDKKYLSERHFVVDKIRALCITPGSYDSITDEPISWVIHVDVGGITHNIHYNEYSEAIAKYSEILDAISECKNY